MQVNTSEVTQATGLIDATTGWRRLQARLGRLLDDARLYPILLILPVLLFFLIWNVIPTLWLVGLSFYKYSLISSAPERFVGVDNFTDIMTDVRGWESLSRTFVWVFVSIFIQTILGGLLGFLFWGSAQMPGRRIALTLLFTPMIITPLAAGVFFRFIYEPTFGIANYVVRLFGGEANFLGDANLAFGAVMFVDIWMWTPFMILITLAALGSVPKAELEAAEIDGLPWLYRIRVIILPHARYVLMLGILLRTIDSFKTLDLIYILTRGGPGATTELIAVMLRRQ
ncbi:MAG: sugar ABC transporter permease, partial [Chitinophagaceae bacterium]|nr:sugar ABC transporter permease [Anaerolineae bacterium]